MLQRYLWLDDNQYSIRLSIDKRYFIIIDTSKQIRKLTLFLLPPSLITASHTVSNIGVTFDSDYNFRKHISPTCRYCFYLPIWKLTFSDLLILAKFPQHPIICWWILHCTSASSRGDMGGGIETSGVLVFTLFFIVFEGYIKLYFTNVPVIVQSLVDLCKKEQCL